VSVIRSLHIVFTPNAAQPVNDAPDACRNFFLGWAPDTRSAHESGHAQDTEHQHEQGEHAQAKTGPR
jgi:hypothetical protein